MKLLPVSGGRLEESKETIQKLNSVSETISDMANSCNEAAWVTLEEDTDIKFKEKKIFHEALLNNIENLENNILYEDIVDDNELIIDDIYDILEQKEFLTEKELIQVFENNNNYIIGIDDENDERNKEVHNDIEQMLRAINYTYRINKLNLMWQKKEASHQKTLAQQLGGVSKVISSLADDIEYGVGIGFIENPEPPKPKFKLQIAVAKTTKNKSEVSGDSSLHTKLNDGKYMLAISDGMGSRNGSKKEQHYSYKNAG